jgi:hypothetical protein
MKLVGVGEQAAFHPLLDASGTITTGGTAQLVLPQHTTRSHFIFTNNSAFEMYVEFGGARATATLSGATVNTSVTIANSGFGYTKPPLVRFMGGGAPTGLNSGQPGVNWPAGVSTAFGPNNGFLGSTVPFPYWPAPPHPAQGHATLSGGSVNAIVVDDPGAAYLYAPYVLLLNNDLDPNGAATPAQFTGIYVPSGAKLEYNGSVCPTQAMAVWCATTSAPFCCKYMT